jgi:uncharacterized MAPEG superfamily protein
MVLDTPADSWGRGKDFKTPPVFERATDTHLNSLESLPVFAVPVLGAAKKDLFSWGGSDLFLVIPIRQWDEN